MPHRCRLIKLNGKKFDGILALYGYESPNYIGHGRFGCCYQVIKNNQEFVFKVFDKNTVKRRKQKVLNEGRILKALNHPGMPAFIENIEGDGVFGLIMEKKSGSALSQFEEMGITFSVEQVFLMINSLIVLLDYLETKNIRHRDIQLLNLLWDSEKISLIDFGSARRISRYSSYFEPDFWGLGDVMIRLFCCSEAFSENPEDTFYRLKLPPEMIFFLKRLLYIEKPFDSFHTIKKQLPDLLHR